MLKFLWKSEGKTGIGTGSKYPKPKKGFVWIHSVNPSQAEIAKLRSTFGLKDTVFEKFKTERKTTRYYFKPLTFTLVDYYVVKGKVMLEDVLFIVGENFLITITNKPLPHYDKMFKNIHDRLRDMKSVGYVFYEILDWDAEENFDVLALTERKISVLEKAVLTSEAIRRKIEGIVDYKRYLLNVWRRLWSSSKIVFSVKKGLTPIKVDADLLRLFDHVHDTFVYQMEIVTTQREVLTDSLTIYEAVLANKLANISNKINTGIKKLTLIMFLWTAIAVILTVPNTIATILGIPEWPITVDAWQFIAIVLAVSTIIPMVWFYLYWKKIKLEA